MWKNWDPHTFLVEKRCDVTTFKSSLQLLKMLESSYELAISFLGIYTRKVKTHVRTHIHTRKIIQESSEQYFP